MFKKKLLFWNGEKTLKMVENKVFSCIFLGKKSSLSSQTLFHFCLKKREMSILSKYKFYEKRVEKESGVKEREVKKEEKKEEKVGEEIKEEEVGKESEEMKEMAQNVEEFLREVEKLKGEGKVAENLEEIEMRPFKISEPPEHVKQFTYKPFQQPNNPHSLKVSIVGLPNAGQLLLFSSFSQEIKLLSNFCFKQKENQLL